MFFLIDSGIVSLVVFVVLSGLTVSWVAPLVIFLISLAAGEAFTRFSGNHPVPPNLTGKSKILRIY